MPKCCIDDQQITFTDVEQTVVPTTRMHPLVDVMYYQPPGIWYSAGIAVDIQILPGVSITVNHGGPATGVIKISGE